MSWCINVRGPAGESPGFGNFRYRVGKQSERSTSDLSTLDMLLFGALLQILARTILGRKGRQWRAYVEMLYNLLKPRLQELASPLLRFHHDGATVHMVRRSVEVSKEHFPGHLVSLHGDTLWLARSLDHAVCGFFLWGCLKAGAFKPKPQTTDEPKDSTGSD